MMTGNDEMLSILLLCNESILQLNIYFPESQRSRAAAVATAISTCELEGNVARCVEPPPKTLFSLPQM